MELPNKAILVKLFRKNKHPHHTGAQKIIRANHYLYTNIFYPYEMHLN